MPEMTEVIAANPLGVLLRQGVMIDVTVPWGGEAVDGAEPAGLTMAFTLARPGDWAELSAIQQMQALADVDGEAAKIGAIVESVCSLVTNAEGVPGFEGRRQGEPLTEFRVRFREYFTEAGADVLLVSVFGSYAEKEMVPLAARRAAFRPPV